MKGGVVSTTYMDGAQSVYVSGKYAYVAGASSDSLAVVDISNPAAPGVIGGVVNTTYMNGAYSVYVSGKYAYVAGLDSDSLAVVDISNRSCSWTTLARSTCRPVVQIVGVESLLADTRDMLRDLDHKRERYEADRVLFTATNANLERAATGTDRVAGFERAIASSFSVAPPANSGARESLAQANARVAEVRVMRDQGLRFVSEPVVAAPSLRRVAAVMAVAILGGIVVAGLATLLVAWWGTVRERMRGAGERVVS